jgi:hypothetical protein
VVQRIRSFEEGCRRGLGIVVRCDRCAKKVTYLCRDFEGYIAPNAEIEELTWRCAWCKAVSTWVCYTMIDVNNREGLAQWTPPQRMKRLKTLTTEGRCGHRRTVVYNLGLPWLLAQIVL